MKLQSYGCISFVRFTLPMHVYNDQSFFNQININPIIKNRFNCVIKLCHKHQTLLNCIMLIIQ